MKSYVAQRLGIAILTLVGMSIVIFALLRLAPGDIVDILFSTAGYVNESEKQAILKELGMDRPYWIQYLDWVRQILTGDLGKSYRYDVPAWDVIRPLVPVTIELAVLSIIVARSEEHTSELQSPCNLVCRLLLEKKKTIS